MEKPEILLMGALPAGDQAALERDFQVHRYWEAPDKPALLAKIAPRLRGIATRGDLGASADVISALPKLEIISCYGVGVDAIDLKAAKARGVVVTNTPDVLTGDVADLALALMLAIARKIPQSDVFARSGAWAKENYPLATRMYGKRLGILGLGRIGKAIARRAEGFDMNVAYHGRSKQNDVTYHFHPTPEALAADSDFLVAITTGGAATQNLINAAVLKALGAKGFFINVSRGSVVDEEALLHALENKLIAGAGLDVFWNEPNLNPRFAKLENVVVLPHIGSATGETRSAMGQLMRDNLAAHFAGRPVLTPV